MMIALRGTFIFKVIAILTRPPVLLMCVKTGHQVIVSRVKTIFGTYYLQVIFSKVCLDC